MNITNFGRKCNMEGKTFVRLIGIIIAILIILVMYIYISYPVCACPGGNSVVYGYGGEDITIGLVVAILCTSTIVLFGLNLKGYLSKSGASFNSIVISFIFVIGTALLNVITFAFFIRPDNEYVMHGATSNVNVPEIISPLIIIGVMMIVVGVVYSKIR